jgi:hypothetical protein
MESREFSDALSLIEWMKQSRLNALHLHMGSLTLDLKRVWNGQESDEIKQT